MLVRALALLMPLLTAGCVAVDPAGGEDASTGGDAATNSGGDQSSGAPTTSSPTTGTSEAGTDTSSGPAATSTGVTGDPEPMGSAGCGLEPNVVATLDVDGEERDWVLHIPDDYDPDTPYALVFAWHGLTSTGQISSLYFGVEAASDGQAIVIYPNGLHIPAAGGTGWDTTASGYDMRFFDALYAELSSKLCIDPARVFSTGHSFGGYMSNALGCYRGDVLRAIAPVASGPPLTQDCAGSVAAWITHGPTDPTVPFSQGEASRDFWATRNSCGSDSEPTTPAPCTALLDCDPDHPVVWCPHDETMMLNGHDWPTFAGAGIWAFFDSL